MCKYGQKGKMPVSECARPSPSGSAAMPRPNGSVFPYFSRFQLRGACLSRRPRAQRAGDEGGYAALVSFAADLFKTSTRLALTPVYLPYIDRINIDVKFFRNNAFHDLDMMVLKQGRIILKNNKFV